MSHEHPYRLELDGVVVAREDEPGAFLYAWEECARTHARPLEAFEGWMEVLLDIDPDAYDWYDVTPAELAAMDAEMWRQFDRQQTGGY